MEGTLFLPHISLNLNENATTARKLIVCALINPSCFKADFSMVGSLWPQGVFNQPWYSASKLRFPILPRSPEAMPSLQQRWSAMNAGSGELREQFLRYLCVESNALESVFLLKQRVSRSGPFSTRIDCDCRAVIYPACSRRLLRRSCGLQVGEPFTGE